MELILPWSCRISVQCSWNACWWYSNLIETQSEDTL